MVSKFLFKILIFGNLILTCSSSSKGQITKGSLEGRILNAQGKDLAGITIDLQPDHQKALSNQQGKFGFKALYEGTYVISIQAIGYRKHIQEVEVIAGQQTSISIKLQAGEEELKEVSVAGLPSNPDNFIDMTRTAMPSKVISRQEIEMMGSRRLDEVLKEQTGMTMVNDMASGGRAIGLQMQGFDSGYTMIMIDGQPMVGRNNGNLDLSRITVSNIERIEIIKGASSCLFGSDALAGVVNIVTRKNITQPQGMASLRYGSFNMIDATVEGETPFADKKGAVFLSGNYYRTDGFNANPYLSRGKTAPPSDTYSIQGRGRYLLNEISTLNFNLRFMNRYSKNRLSYQELNPTEDVQNEYDLNGSVALNHNFRSGWKLKSQYYLTRYQTKQTIEDLTSGMMASGSDFKQYLHRVEWQAAKQMTRQLEFTGGLGGAYELLLNNFYRGNKQMSNYFAFGQLNWQALAKLLVTGGGRFDYHDQYGSRFNPSLGMRYDLASHFNLRAAIASGFKTPNFQQLYLIFTNVQTGYSVFGAEEFPHEIMALQEAGQLMSVFPSAQKVGTLRPERSLSYSGGFAYQPIPKIKLDVNVFYNDMKDFINSEQVAIKTNAQQIYSYMNIARAYTTGAEIGLSYHVSQSLNLSAGYQLLYAFDKGVMDSIKNGTGLYEYVYDLEQNKQRRSTTEDYVGLNNRSRHMVNVKVSYAHEPLGLTGSFRVNYRSKYGFMEANRSNNFLDPWDTYVSSFFLLNASVQKNFSNKHLQMQVTVDNIMNYRDQLIPGQPGRAVLAGLSWRFFKDK
ncbi:MAG: TonB-dependent receptor [Bacteroidota bacterium]